MGDTPTYAVLVSPISIWGKMIEIVSSKWILVWLKGRNKKDLIAISNPMCLVVGFAETNKSDGVMCKITELKNNPEILKLHKRIQSKQQGRQQDSVGPMKQRWVSYAISPNR